MSRCRNIASETWCSQYCQYDPVMSHELCSVKRLMYLALQSCSTTLSEMWGALQLHDVRKEGEACI